MDAFLPPPAEIHLQLLMEEHAVRQSGQSIVAGSMSEMTREGMEISMRSLQQLIMAAEEANQDQSKQDQSER